MKCALCHKELPTDYKVPLCDYHRARGVETAEKVGVTALGVAAFVINGGGELLKTGGSTIVRIVKDLSH